MNDRLRIILLSVIVVCAGVSAAGIPIWLLCKPPFITAALVSLGAMLVLILIGMVLFRMLWCPMAEKIERQAEDLKRFNETLEHRVKKRTDLLSRQVRDLETIFNNSQVGIMILKGGRFLHRGNQRLADILGYETPEKMAGISMRALHLDEERYQEFGIKYYAQLSAGEMLQIEYRLKRRDGSCVWCTLSGKVLDEKNHLDPDKGVIWAVDDISERMEMEKKLRLQSQIISQVHDSVISVDLDGLITFWNQGSVNLFLYTAGEIIGKSVKQIYPAGSHARLENETIPQLLRDGFMEVEVELVRRDGSLFDAMVSLSILKDDEGKINGMIGYTVDVTERRQAEAKLKASEQKFRTLFNAAAIPLCYASDKGVVLDFNPKFTRMFGYTRQEIPTLDEWWRLAYPDPPYRNWVMANWDNAVAEASENKTEIRSEAYKVTCRDGGVKEVLISGAVFQASVLTTFIDITEIKRAERELDRSNKELEQFAYVASHDLQEPLRAVVGFLQLLETRYRDQLDEKGMHYIDRSVKAGHRMQTLITDLLTLSRVNTKGRPFENIDLNQIVAHVRDSLETMISEKKVVITHQNLPAVYGDRGQVTSLFQNIIINGIKYNRSAAPKIDIDFDLQNDLYIFYFKDNGMGIEPRFHTRIFQVFQRLHTNKEIAGTGLGLSLCKKIVERHGGAMGLDSEPGKGSTFYFTLPIKGGMQ